MGSIQRPAPMMLAALRIEAHSTLLTAQKSTTCRLFGNVFGSIGD
jgi:hypothetical protein